MTQEYNDNRLKRKALTPVEAAAYLGISRRKLMKLFREGKIPGQELSYRIVRFSEAGLEAYLANKQ